MKRTTRKLAIRSETVRALGVLDLARVGGGDAFANESRTGGSGDTCPIAVALASDAAVVLR